MSVHGPKTGGVMWQAVAAEMQLRGVNSTAPQPGIVEQVRCADRRRAPAEALRGKGLKGCQSVTTDTNYTRKPKVTMAATQRGPPTPHPGD